MVTLLGLAPLVTAALFAAAGADQVHAQSCTLPIWDINDVGVTYSTESSYPGEVTFEFQGKNLSCTFASDNQCEIREDGVAIQAHSEGFAVGTAMLNLTCSGKRPNALTCAGDETQIESTVSQ